MTNPSHPNHALAREELKVRSLIKASIGRPTHKAATSKYRRRMQRELIGSQKGKLYGRRAQSESTNSMIKRNRELMLKVLAHNLMIIRRQK